MTPVNEKAQTISWSNPNKVLNDENSSFKKKKKFVYLDKYEDTIKDLKKDIVSLKHKQVKLWVGIAVVLIVQIIITFNLI
jgi:hypothetical protein